VRLEGLGQLKKIDSFNPNMDVARSSEGRGFSILLDSVFVELRCLTQMVTYRGVLTVMLGNTV
jgi:hypothetical protein